MATKPQLPKPGASQRETKGKQVDQAVVTAVVSGVLDHLRNLDSSGQWFGPLQPQKPLAQEQAVGRLLDFATGYNLRQTPRQEENITFGQLRALSENCDILRIILETRKDQIEAIDWKIKAKEGRTVDDATVAKVTDFFLKPSSEYDWCGWIRAMCEDMLVLDAVSIYPRYTRGGDLYSFDLIDSATIKRVIDDTGRTPTPPDPAYQQILHGVVAANYSADDLIYFMRNPRTHKLYGYSPVEQIVTTVNVAIRKAMFQLQYYTEGNIPEALAGVPETWGAEDIKAFQMYWDELIEGNTAIRRHMRFVPLDPTKIKETKQVDLKDKFDEWLARVVCYAFSVSPSAFISETNRAVAESVQEEAKQQGLMPVLRFLKKRVDYLITRYMRCPDLEFHWEMNEAIDAKTQAEIDQIYFGMKGVLTPDEIRKERLGKPPLSDAEKEAAWPTPEVPGIGPDGKPLPRGAPGSKPPFGSKPGQPGSKPPFGSKPKPGEDDDEEGQLRRAGINKLVIAPVIHVPERSVTVGDVNVTAHIPANQENQHAATP